MKFAVAEACLYSATRSRRAVLVLLLAFLVPVSWAAVAGDRVPAKVDLTKGRVLVIGDSITQDGRYVTFVEYFLKRLSPASACDLISIGLSSETVSGLSEIGHPYPRPCVLERLDRALTATKPGLVVACYGMNDGIYHPSSSERLRAFGDGLRQLVDRVHAAGAALVIVTPPVFDSLPIRARTVPATAPEFGYSKPFVDYDSVLAEFAAIERAVSGAGVTVIDLHAAMVAAIATERKRDAAFTFAPDGVHPGDAGHLLMARVVFNGLGYSLPAGSEFELARIMSDPLFELIRERRQLRSEAWLPFVGYRREASFKSASVTAAEQVVARLQQEIDALS
ncbi:MAG: SGNH/GDSL hydrolase family protein, partial [Opitutus sp.]